MSDSISPAPTGDPQTPDPAAAFYDITAGSRHLSAWDAMFEEADELLQASVLDGIKPEDIGRTAWDLLPNAEQPEALDKLFYTYWSAKQNDAEELARHERDRTTRAALRVCLDEFETLARFSAPVSRELVTDMAALARTLVGGAL